MGRLAALAGGEDHRIRTTGTERYPYTPERPPGGHATIPGDDQIDGMAEPRQRAWKRTHDIREAACFRKGGSLGCDHQDTHVTSTLALSHG